MAELRNVPPSEEVQEAQLRDAIAAMAHYTLGIVRTTTLGYACVGAEVADESMVFVWSTRCSRCGKLHTLFALNDEEPEPVTWL